MAGQIKALRFFLGHLSKFADSHRKFILQAPLLLETLLELRGIISPLGHSMRISPDDQTLLDAHVVPLLNGIVEVATHPLEGASYRYILTSLDLFNKEFKEPHEVAGAQLCFVVAARKFLLSQVEHDDAVLHSIIPRLLMNLDHMLSAILVAFADELPRAIAQSPASFDVFNLTLSLLCSLCKTSSSTFLNSALNELFDGLISHSLVVSFLCTSALEFFSRQCTSHQRMSILRSLYCVMQSTYEENAAQCFSSEQYRIARLLVMIHASHDGEITSFLRSGLLSKSVFASCASLSCSCAILHWMPSIGNFSELAEELYADLLPVCCSRLGDVAKKDCVPLHSIMPILSISASVLRLCQGSACSVPSSRPGLVGQVFDAAILLLQKSISSELQESSEFCQICVAAVVAAIGSGHVSCSHVCTLLSFVSAKCSNYLQSNSGLAVALTQVISACAAVIILPCEGINMSAGLAKFTSLSVALHT